MKRILVFSALVLSTMSFALDVLKVRLVPSFKYEQSLFSCEHSEQVFEFALMGNIENGKLTSAALKQEESRGASTWLSGVELSGTAVELDSVSKEWWLSKLTLSAPTLYWVFAHLEDSIGSSPCPLKPLSPVAIDPAVATFSFGVFLPGIDFGTRYADPVAFKGTRQAGSGSSNIRRHWVLPSIRLSDGLVPA